MINSTYKKANRLLYTILIVCIVQLGWTQIYPVQVNSNVLPPYLSAISKYSTTTDQKYLVNIFTSDLSVVNRQVKLKLYLQGNGINAQSTPVVVGASPLFINGGESLQLNNIDLAPYFELQNLQGINPLQYSGVLPQGNYNFCIEVYDFVTNQPISQKSCTFFYFIYNDPPLLNLPTNHEVIFFQEPQNIIFTWTPRHINATNIEYQFELIELLDNQAPSNYAFIVGAPVWQETLNNTILNYNFNLPQLVAGKKYAWRVKAVSQPGFGEDAIFNNNGYSEIYDFIYAGNCSAPEFVLAQSTSATQAKIMWQTNTNHLANVVQYRKVGTEEWFNAPVANGQALLFDLEPTVTYEFQVGGTCLGNITTFSAINQFTQPVKDQVAINCGIAPAIDLTNVTLYNEELQKDMIFMAADYAIHINESEGVGTYTGKGWTRAPYLKNIKIAVEFENIKLNSELKLVEGEVKAQYDPEWSNILDVNEVIDIIDDMLDPFQASNDVHNHQVNFVIVDSTHIVVQNGQIIITTSQGTTGATFEFDQGENTTITDSNGSVYNVDGQGNVTLVQQGIGIPNSSNTENLNSNGQVTALSNVGAKVVFKNNDESKAFDDSSANYSNAPPKLAKKYKTIKDGKGNDYPFYYKAVINNEDGVKTTDLVTAEITITDTLIKPKDIVFNLKGQKVEEKSSSTVGNVTTKVLEVPAFTTVGENELLALVKIKTDSVKQKVIGAMTVIPIKNVGTVNVTLVPVNGATVSSTDINAIKNIYSKAGVALNITIAPPHTDAITTLECGTSGWIANYTTEQNAFIDRYKAGKTISDTQYYIFVTKGITPSRPLSGFMPLHRQYGFVFSDETRAGETKQTEGSRLAIIIAHELGHGAFELEHPWEKFDYNKGDFSTNWLMDYASGKQLPYMHWQQISHPKTKLYLFQSDSSGEFNQNTFISVDYTSGLDFYNEISSTNISTNCTKTEDQFYFRTISGSIIKFNKNDWDRIDKTSLVFKKGGVLKSFIIDKGDDSKYKGLYTLAEGYKGNEKVIFTSFISHAGLKSINFPTDTKTINGKSIQIYKDFYTSESRNKYAIEFNEKIDCAVGIEIVIGFDNNGKPICANLSSSDCVKNDPSNIATIDCEDPSNVTKTNDKIAFLKNVDFDNLSISELEPIMKSNLTVCVVSEMDFALRKKILQKYISIEDDGQWEIGYDIFDAQNDHFFIKDIILSTPIGQRVELLKYLNSDEAANIYNGKNWLQLLYEKGESWLGISNDISYQDIFKIFIEIGDWASANNQVLGIVPNKTLNYTFNNTQIENKNLFAGEIPFFIGKSSSDQKYDLKDDFNKSLQYYVLNTKVNFNNRKINLYNKFTNSIVYEYTSNYSAYGGGMQSSYPVYGDIFVNDNKFNPYEFVTVIPNKKCFGLEPNKEYVIPAIQAFAIQWYMDEEDTNDNLRKFGDGTMIIAGVIAAPLSGGTSLAGVAAALTTGGIVVGTTDMIITDLRQKGEINPDSEAYKMWNNFYTTYTVLEGGVNITSMAYTGVSKLNILNASKAFNGLDAISSTLNAVTKAHFDKFRAVINAGSITKATENFYSFGNMFFKGVKLKSFIAAGMMTFTVTVNNVDIAVLKNIQNLPELVMNVTGRIQNITPEITNVINANKASLIENLVQAENTLIKTSATEAGIIGKVAFKNVGDNVIIASQINNQITFTVLSATASSLEVYQKVNDSEDPNLNCTICPNQSGNTKNSTLCQKLEQLAVNTQNQAGVQKLCPVINLSGVVDKLLTYTVAEQKAFLNDINSDCNNTKSLCAHISSIDVYIVDAWKLVIDNATIGTSFAKDWDVLQEVKDIVNTPSKMEAFGPFNTGTIRDFNEFLNTYMTCTPCNTCPTPTAGSWTSRFPKLDAVLKNSVEIYLTHKNTPDFLSSFYCGEVLAKNAISKRDGGQFMLRYMAENNITNQSQMVDRRFEYVNPNAVNKQKEFDIFLGNTNPNALWFIECKSYEETTPIDVEQLKAYFSSIDKIANLQYVFNKDKMSSEAVAKTAVQALIYDKTTNVLKDKGNELFEVIWGNGGLSKSLFGNDIDLNDPQDKIDSKEDFKVLISSLSDNFYKFIIVK